MMLLSVIVPAYNERATILETLQRVSQVDLSALGVKKEIIVVDDCSSDGTWDILTKNARLCQALTRHEVNKGKGAAIRTGLRHAKGDVLIVQDADQEYSPEEYPLLLKPILEGRAKVVYGSRFLNKKVLSEEKWAVPIHYLGNRGLSLITSVLYFRWVTDMETCYKMFTREVLESLTLRAQRFDFEPEITAKIIKAGYGILEVPISYHSRPFSEGKKISWRDGVKAAWYLLKYRFVD